MLVSAGKFTLIEEPLEPLDNTFTVNHKEVDTKLICLVQHAIEHEKKLDYAIYIVRSTSGDIAITVILLNDEANNNVLLVMLKE